MTISFWSWFILAIILVVLEVFAPGILFIWMAIAAGITGIALWLQPDMGWEYQVILFATLSVVTTLAARAFFKKRPIETTNPLLNERGSEYIGRKFKLAKPVEQGVGQVRIGDSLWRVSCDDELQAGDSVEVIGVDGATLKVKSVD